MDLPATRKKGSSIESVSLASWVIFDGPILIFVVYLTTCSFSDFVLLLEFCFLLPMHKVMYTL